MFSKVLTKVGQPQQRIDALEKVEGTLKYAGDLSYPDTLHAKLATSTYAHAKLKDIHTDDAWKVPGVRAVITGKMFPFHIGPILADRPPLAIDKVRYYGEPVALVVADNEYQAKQAALSIKVDYEPLPVVNSAKEAFQKGSPDRKSVV